MTIHNSVEELLVQALHDLDNSKIPLSTVIKKSVRIASIRNDYWNLYWLRMELLSINDKDARLRNEVETAYYLGFEREEWKKERKRIDDKYFGSRIVDKTKMLNSEIDDPVLVLSVLEIEANLPIYEKDIEQVDESIRHYAVQQLMEVRSILSRIHFRVHSFLVATENQILSGKIQSDIFLKQRQFVELNLEAISPDTLKEMHIAESKIRASNNEEWCFALMSCRRALNFFANDVYPPRSGIVLGVDGKNRQMGEEQYVNRLVQFASEHLGKSKRAEALIDEVKSLGDRMRNLVGLASKGIHSYISREEAEQCVIQTFMLLSYLLKITKSDTPIIDE